MIRYNSDIFGLKTLLIWHGSAVYRALLPATFSTSFMFILKRYLNGSFWEDPENILDARELKVVQEPYTITVFIAFFSFLLAFRLNYSYQRYWEACTNVHTMHSKWTDAAILVASFHYQCAQYDSLRPLTFGANPKIRNETREREHLHEMSLAALEKIIEKAEGPKPQRTTDLRKGVKFWKHMFLRKRRTSNPEPEQQQDHPEANHHHPPPQHQQQQHPSPRKVSIIEPQKDGRKSSKAFKPNRSVVFEERNHFTMGPQQNFLHQSISGMGVNGADYQLPKRGDSLRSEWRASFVAKKAQGKKGQAQSARLLGLIGLDTPTPSLFLQEAAHLFSLLSAVAMATLRADVQGTVIPLSVYIPGAPFPPVNPDELSADIKKEYLNESAFWTCVFFLLGIRRSRAHRTLYNAARPFKVIGGVSDDELKWLSLARGPYAQMALCNMWLKEFISREHLHGSTGKVESPIISRVYKFISDGVKGYNHSRMISFVPFPFPHAQVTVFFSMTILFLFPCLFISFVNNARFAYCMNFTTVLCFVGIHEVARELEHPYFNFPNDLPLNNFQAQFNEALMTMYAGFHPDSYREHKEEVFVVETVDEAEPEAMEHEEKKDIDELEVEDLFQEHAEQPELEEEPQVGRASSFHLSQLFEEEKLEEEY